MRTEFDNEIIGELKEEIGKGEVLLHNETSSIIKAIEKKFPFVYSGIDWTRVNTLYFIDFKENDLENKYEIIEAILEKIFKDELNSLDEQIIVLGDYETNIGYEMSYLTFFKKFRIFLDLPQDTYVWFPKLEKCLNYTFEDEIYFA